MISYLTSRQFIYSNILDKLGIHKRLIEQPDNRELEKSCPGVTNVGLVSTNFFAFGSTSSIQLTRN